MLNQVMIVGRLTKISEIKEGEKKTVIVTVAVPRCFKNTDGEYETDFVELVLEGNLATNTVEYCKKGDIIGVKGRIESSEIESKDGSKKYEMKNIAEKVTFLSSSKKTEEE